MNKRIGTTMAALSLIALALSGCDAATGTASGANDPSTDAAASSNPAAPETQRNRI